MAVRINSDASALKRSANAPSQTAYTLAGWFYFDSVTPARFWGPLGIYAGTDGTPGNNYHQISAASSGSAAQTLTFVDNTATTRTVALATMVTGTWNFLALSCSSTAAGGINAYHRKLQDRTLTVATSANTAASFTPARMEWGRDSFSGDFIDGTVMHALAFDRVLTAPELMRLSLDLLSERVTDRRNLNVYYRLRGGSDFRDLSLNGREFTATTGVDRPSLRVVPRRRRLVATAGAAAYTLTATTATFTLTGNAAGLKVDRKLAAAQQTYALTGNATGLRRGYSLAAATSAFTLTGNAAGLVAARNLTAAQATYALTGNAAGLAVARKLSAASASYALTGIDVTLTYTPKAGAYVLPAASVTFVLTGNDAALIYAPTPTPSPAPPAPTPAGRSKRPHRYFVEIDGQQFLVDSAAEARRLLERARALAEHQAEERTERVVKRLRRKAVVPQVRVEAPEITVSPELRADLVPVINDITRLYQRAAELAELRLLMLQEMRDEADDEDDLLLLM